MLQLGQLRRPDDAVATQDTVTQLIAGIRKVRREVPGAADIIAAACRAHDYDDPGKPGIVWDDQQAREALVSALVGDACTIIDALTTTGQDAGLDAELDDRAAQALLALVAGQDVEPAEGSDGTDGRWRIARRVAADRVISVVDPEARHAHKTVHHRQDGFKGHVAVEPDTGLFTNAKLTKALGGTAYGTGQARAELADAGHTAIIKPAPLRPAVDGGFTTDDFTVDEQVGTATCPNGVTRRITPQPGGHLRRRLHRLPTFGPNAPTTRPAAP